jgi:hypothetical protein
VIHVRSFARLALLALATGLSGCSASDDSDASTSEDDLTSLTARSRTLTFAGVVYVAPGTSDSSIIATVRKQTQSAFGALREANVGVNSRELKDVDAKTFVKSDVTVVDPAIANDPGRKLMRVAYTFTDNAVVPTPMAKRSSIALGVLNPNYEAQNQRVFDECTTRDAHATEFRNGSLWYVFDPSLKTCTTAMAKEQKAIDADRTKIGGSNVRLPKSEVERLYIPTVMALGRDATNTKISYPEYDRLYAGGVEPGKVVIGMVSGMMADWAAGEHHELFEDQGYDMWFGGLREIFAARPGMKLASIEPKEDLTAFVVDGKTYTFPTFDDLIKFELDRVNPSGITSTTRPKLQAAIAQKLGLHWIIFEAPVQVTVAGKTTPVTIKLQTYFGAEGDSTPHKRAIKTSDIFVYNGHSYIGYGPLDPSRFTAADFPKSYQVMMINGCVSYNYYEKDYFPLKTGGTANLELVTNGLESWVNESGPAMGRFVGAFIDGKMNSYTAILKAAQFKGYGYSWGQDALRVVDGELDNVYDPKKKPITVK